jgi:type IV pilus assembly protein PilC
MLFSRRLSLAALIELCRAMRYSLQSGLMLRDTIDLLANKGSRQIRPVAARIGKDLKSGWSLQDALQKQEKAFPPLFVALAAVGEESGNLPEVLAELERYYILRQKLNRDFLSQISWPVIQLIAALLIITCLIWILGVLPARSGEERIDPLGLGLIGEEGALTFLLYVAGAVVGITALYLFAQRMLRRRAVVERFLLLIPGLGPCLRAMAMARFCVAGRLMLETSLSIFKTLRLAFVATDNMAFISVFPLVEASIRQGNTIAASFSKARVFDEKFLSGMAVAEESGRMPEALRFMAEEYDEETKRRMTWLTRIGSFLVWLTVAGIIILCIFRIFTEVYLKQINKNLPAD